MWVELSSTSFRARTGVVGYITLWMVAVPSSPGRTYSGLLGTLGGMGQDMSKHGVILFYFKGTVAKEYG